MKLDSPLFDRIRVKPGEDRRLRTACPGCDWPGCHADSTHRAPKGRLREGEYWCFKMGVNGGKPGGGSTREPDYLGAADPFGMFRELGIGGPWRPAGERATPERRPVRNAERKAFDVMGLETDASATDIKAKFKVLVKRHHPDANGGDRSCEDRLREIIQAYNYLKSVGYC